MNLNDNNKAKSVKLNARNLQELKMETVTLAQESKEMEEKLQQLKESMSKEKEERGHSEGFRWKSGQCGSLNTNSITKSMKNNMENRLQKLSAGRVKIRVLKDEPLTASPRPLPPPLAPTTSLRTVRKNRLRGTICGQCEVKTAGLMCAECTENFCIGCFAKFHQKGALKLHKMIPIQTNLQTHVSTPDVFNCSQKQIDHSLFPGTFTNLVPSPDFKSRCNPHHNFTSSTSPRNGDQNPEEGPKDVSQAMPFYPDPSQVLVMNRLGEKKAEVKEEGLKKKNEEDFPMSLLRGQYSEEESARSFQKALKQWRGEKSHPTGEPTCDSGMWKPVRRVSAIATQVDLRPSREIGDGRTSGGLVVRIPVKVKFMENSLTYMDRLLLKQHRRTPIEPFTSLGLSKDLKFLSNTYAEEETANSLTAQEEDFRQYCSSLFAVPISRSGTEPQITTPESCLVIQVLDDTNRDINGLFAAVQRTDSNQNVPYVQWVSSTGRTLVPQRSLTSSGSSSISSPSIPTQRSSKSTIAAQTKPAQRLNPFKPQTSQAEHLLTLMPSKSKTPACPTVETPRTSKTSIKTPNLKSQKPNFSPTVQKTKADLGSPQPLLTLSLLDCQTKITKFSHSLPLFSPDISPVHKDISLLPEQTLEPESSELLPEPITSAKLSQFRLTSLEIVSQSQHCLSSKPDLQQKYLESNSSSDLSLFNESTPPYEHASVFMSFTPITGDHEPTRSNHFFPSLTSQLLNNIHIPMKAVKEEDVLSIDSADEISSDSLGLAPHEEDSSEEEAQMHRHIMRGGSRGEEQGKPAISHLGDSFVSADAEQEEDLQTDETVQLEDPSMVLHNQSAGPGLELFCDLHGFKPLGLDVNSVHSDTPEHTHCDPLHACQTSSHNSHPLVSKVHGSGSSFSVYAEEHLVFKMMDNVSQSATPTGEGEISANELRASRSSPIPASVRSSLSYSSPPPFCLSHPSLASEMGPALCSLSQAAQEIMEICCVDQTGCEDPDLDSDTSAHTIHSLEQELRLMAKEIGAQASVFGMGNSGSQDQRGTQRLTRVDEKQKEEEETKQRDWQSVLLLP